MQRLTGIMLVAAVGAAMLSGCALRDPRATVRACVRAPIEYFHLRDPRADYAYSRASDGLWGDAPFELIDWNFPTSRNQPPIEVPKRIRFERTAIGVTWATRNPLPLSENLAPYDAPTTSAVNADDRMLPSNATPARSEPAGVAAADRERRGAR